MMCTEQEQERRKRIRLDGVEVKRVDAFQYLESTPSADGNEGKEITAGIQAGWKSWRDVSGVLCDRKLPVNPKGKVYKTVVKTTNDVRGEGSICEENKREEDGSN